MKRNDKCKGTVVEHFQFFKQLNLSGVQFKHLNPKGKIYCI